MDARFLQAHTKAHACIAATIVNRADGGAKYSRVSVGAFEKLCATAAKMVHEGSCRQGLRLNGLCGMAGVSTGHVRDHFNSDFANAGALTTRAMLMSVGSVVLYDVVDAQWAETREAKSLGAIDDGVRHLAIAPTSENTSCPDRVRVLVTGTRHDRAHPQADHAAIEDFEAKLGEEIPSTVPEHLRMMLQDDRDTRDLARGSGEAFAELGVGRRCNPADAFPLTLVVPVVGVGPALEDRDLGAELYIPGRDPEMIALAEAANGR